MDMTKLGTHFRSLIAKQKETDSARCSASVMKMMSVGDTFTVDFQQNFPDDTYAKAFLAEASNHPEGPHGKHQFHQVACRVLDMT